MFFRSAWQFLSFPSALTQLPLNYVPAVGCCSTAEEGAISSLLNVHFSIKMMTENGCHSQPRKHTTTLANKYRFWWEHYLHTGKTKACKQRKRRSTWIMFLHQRPNHLRLYHGTSALSVVLVKDEVSLTFYDRHVKYIWEKTASWPSCWRSSEVVPHLQFHTPVKNNSECGLPGTLT